MVGERASSKVVLGGESIVETAGQPTTPKGLSSLVDRIRRRESLVIDRVGDGTKRPALISINVHSFTSGVEMDGSCQRARWHSQLSGLTATSHRHNGCPHGQTAVFPPRAFSQGGECHPCECPGGPPGAPESWDGVLICLNAQ